MALLDDPESHHSLVFDGLSHLINVRKRQGLPPQCHQYTLHFGDAVFAFWQQSLNRDQYFCFEQYYLVGAMPFRSLN